MSEINKFKELLHQHTQVSFSCGEHRVPREYAKFEAKQRETERALVEWVEKREARIEDLLAVIHRDGGHHTINAGMERSIADAAQEIHRLRADAEKWATNASDGDGVSDLYEDAPKEERDWLIFYEDTACPPNHFGGTEAHAKKMLEEAGQNWTCHLYLRVASV